MTTNSQNQTIFIHSLWRAGSTYIFNAFRRSEAGYWAYQEPVHELALRAKTSPDILTNYTSEALAPLRHPQLDKAYFYELQQTHQEWHDVIEKKIIYDNYFSESSIEPLAKYLHALIASANGRPVIQECRTSSRIGAIKQALGGLHLYLWRNPWDQWWSFKINDYFDAACQIVLGANPAPPIVARLKEEIGYVEFHHDEIAEELRHFEQHRLSSEDSYLVFYTLWCLGLLEGTTYADHIINIDALSTSIKYREETANNFKALGIQGVDFSDCHIPQAFFDTTDNKFFKGIETRVHGLLLTSGYTQELINTILNIRLEHAPTTHDDSITLVRDLHRARETALRFETSEASLGKHSQHIIDNLKAQAQAFERNFNVSNSSLANITVQLQNNELDLRKTTELLESTQANFRTGKDELHNILQDRTKREQELSEQTNQARQELAEFARTLAERELQAANQLLMIQQEVRQDKADLTQNHQKQLQEILLQHTLLEQNLTQQAQVTQQEVANLLQDQTKREQVLSEQAAQAKKGLEDLLHTKAQREQEAATQLVAIQQQYAQEKFEQSRNHIQQERALHQQYAEREQTFTLQLQVSQQQLSDLHVAQVKTLQQQRTALELSLNQQIKTNQQALRQLEKDNIRREQAASSLLLTTQKQAAKQLNELVSTHNEQVHALQRQIAEREQVLNQQHSFEINAKQNEYNRLLETSTVLETQLKTEIQSEQQTSLQLRQELADVAQSLAITHASFTWRIMAPLRKLASFITPINNKDTASFMTSKTELPHAALPPVLESQTINIQDTSIESNIQLPTQAFIQSASTLDELLAYYDLQFVHYAFRTLLGRAPDPEGLSYYLGRIRSGISKIQILAQIRSSAEGMAHASILPGLKKAIKLYKRGQYPLIGWLFRKINSSPSNHATERKQRSIENQLHSLSNETNLHFKKLEDSPSSMQHWVEQQTLNMPNTRQADVDNEFDETHSVLTIEDLQHLASQQTLDILSTYQTTNIKNLKEKKNLLTIESLLVIAAEIN